MSVSDPLPGPAPAEDPPRAGAFIVTIYGDVVLPRGGALWMGSLIGTCAAQGISESLVRTAVSRLVAGGQLEGERQGRRSFYRLTAGAAADYTRAGRLFYGAPPAPAGWRLALGPLPEALPQPWARLGAEAALAPDHADLPGLPGAVLHVPGGTAAALPEAAARLWPLAEAAAGYRRVLDAFGAGKVPSDGAEALALRLRLIHRYRQAVLRDPRLPVPALPPDWPGMAARRCFARLYTDLSGPADAHVGESLRDSQGFLPATTPDTAARLARLAGDLLT